MVPVVSTSIFLFRYPEYSASIQIEIEISMIWKLFPNDKNRPFALNKISIV